MQKVKKSNKMNKLKITLLYLLLFQMLTAFAQVDKVETNVSITDTADISILAVFPDSFPNISVLFRAETRKNKPIWDLDKSKMQVLENGEDCDVISLEQVSKNKPINIGVVFDHSISMRHKAYSYRNRKAIMRRSISSSESLSIDSLIAIENAKNAVNEFVSSFNSNKDYISLIGFSDVVDVRIPLSNDIENVKSTINSLSAEGSTALYDAMLESIKSVSGANGVKVLVVITDGNDNSSRFTWHKVVDEANKNDIPIFIIGLGDVNIDTLQAIAEQTKGQFYYTKDSKSLNGIYSLISKQVQSFYNLVYQSSNIAEADTNRRIELSFNIDSIYVTPNSTKIELPKEVVAYMVKKEKERSYFVKGGIATVALISVGVLLLYYRRKNRV